MFMKDECYTDWKYPRMINARSDYAKCIFGPWVAAAEAVLFERAEFIKKVPHPMRPDNVVEALQMFKYVYASDFTTYEASFVRKIMESCEFKFFRHMCQYIPGVAEFMATFESTLGGWNKCMGKWVTLYILATRMSGEMDTSSGNGFTTFMLFEFVAMKSGARIRGRYEGDDALVGADSFLREELFGRLGFRIKLQRFEELSEASFCGMVFDRQDKKIITDPFKVLASFGWTSGKYACASATTKKMLLRAKALSLAYQYPSCPVLQSLARCVLRLTTGYDVRRLLNSRNMSSWERERLEAVVSFGEKRLRDMVESPIPHNTRVLFERLYRIDESVQLHIEAQFDSIQELGVFDLPVIDHLANPVWKTYHERYVIEVPVGTAPRNLSFR